MTHKHPEQKNGQEKDRQSPVDVGVENLPVVQLTEKEYRLCKLIAQARALFYEDIDGGSVFGSQNSAEAHLTGVLGEFAFQKHTENIEQAIYVYGDPGWDVVHQGYKVDVKCTETHLEYPDLLVPAKTDIMADVFVLAHRTPPREIRLVGWAPAQLVAAKEPEQYPGTMANRVVRPHELRPP